MADRTGPFFPSGSLSLIMESAHLDDNFPYLPPSSFPAPFGTVRTGYSFCFRRWSLLAAVSVMIHAISPYLNRFKELVSPHEKTDLSGPAEFLISID